MRKRVQLTEEEALVLDALLLAENTTADMLDGRQAQWVLEHYGEKKSRKGFLIVSALVLSAAFAASLFLKSRFPYGTRINGHDVGFLSVRQAERVIRDETLAGDLVLEWENGTKETVPLSSLGCEVRTVPEIGTLLDSDMSGWLPWHTEGASKEVLVSIIPDDVRLGTAVSGLSCVKGEGTEDPVDARFVRSNGHFRIEKEKPGTIADPGRLSALIRWKLAEGNTSIPLAGEDVFLKAHITSENRKLKKVMEEAMRFENTRILLDLDGAEETVDWGVFGDWVSCRGGQFELDRGAVADYVSSLAAKYDTLGRPRTFAAATGEITSAGGGALDNFGYLMDRDATTEAIAGKIEACASETVPAVWESRGAGHGAQNDFGDTYIEVSIARQHMWFRQDGDVIFETDVVTGMDTDGRRTPAGAFKILDKKSDYTMSGSYGTAYCNYVFAISEDGICIHDSTWRDSYGGDIWRTNGSHGCINTPLSKMAELYGMDSIVYGMPVIVY